MDRIIQLLINAAALYVAILLVDGQEVDRDSATVNVRPLR